MKRDILVQANIHAAWNVVQISHWVLQNKNITNSQDGCCLLVQKKGRSGKSPDFACIPGKCRDSNSLTLDMRRSLRWYHSAKLLIN
jgi:hypothetical protein